MSYWPYPAKMRFSGDMDEKKLEIVHVAADKDGDVMATISLGRGIEICFRHPDQARALAEICIEVAKSMEEKNAELPSEPVKTGE